MQQKRENDRKAKGMAGIGHGGKPSAAPASPPTGPRPVHTDQGVRPLARRRGRPHL